MKNIILFRALIHKRNDNELEGEWRSAWDDAANDLRSLSGDIDPVEVQFYRSK